MNINRKILIFFMTIIFCQFQISYLKAEDVKSIDDEELPAIDPFAGSAAGSTNQSLDQPKQSNQSKQPLKSFAVTKSLNRATTTAMRRFSTSVKRPSKTVTIGKQHCFHICTKSDKLRLRKSSHPN